MGARWGMVSTTVSGVGDRDNTQGGNSGKLSGAIMWQKTINGKNLKALEESRLVDFGY